MQDPTPYAKEVMQTISDCLFEKKIAHDTGSDCVYFNDTKAKKTYRVILEECDEYEGD